MTIQQAVKKFLRERWVKRDAGMPTIVRRDWVDSDLDWTLSVHVVNGDIYWSHRTPYTRWQPSWQDLEADDWEIA